MLCVLYHDIRRLSEPNLFIRPQRQMCKRGSVEYWGRNSPSDQCSQQRAVVCELTADTVRAGCAPYAVARGQLHAIHLASCSRLSAAVGRRCLLAFAGRPAACRVFVSGDSTATPCWSSNASCSAKSPSSSPISLLVIAHVLREGIFQAAACFCAGLKLL